ncbi:MAG: tannase/feruloyl esterase family alpha/beta hydrolase [Asticcacaulis sp.]
MSAVRLLVLALLLAVAPLPALAKVSASGCAALSGQQLSWPGDRARIVEAHYNAPASGLPAHCDVTGIMHERQGRFGQSYAIRFHMRLPEAWNGRMVFQGGGGSDGDIGDALGHVSSAGPVALALGYVVVSQDAGHDNATNTDPAHNGALAFGFDPVARADYGHTSLKASADAAKAVIRAAYGRGPRYSYFVGCSKGGQEGMTFAQLYPGEFDGIIATAPGFSLPRAAVAEAWDVQAFAAVAGEPGKVRLGDLAKTFSAADFDLVRASILDACDGDDGVKDGMVGDFAHCTAEKVLPVLQDHLCAGAKAEGCLTLAQIVALRRVTSGVKTPAGQQIYSGWFWPSAISAPDWRMWKIGSADGRIPALNVLLGGGSLASVFTTPPVTLGDPQSVMEYQLAFRFDRDANRIYTVAEPFTHSAWADIASRSADLGAFKARGGKMIVVHGESDPVFSLKDTLDWFDEVNAREKGRAGNFVRVFPVPGMCHCGGGVSTDQYDMFAALIAWVERGQAPDAIIATAGNATPWPGRTRPLCAYPEMARYTAGDVEKASSFACRVAD